jgi:hypothetical protein
MNQSHVIDSWIAELALGAWSKPARPASEVAAEGWGREPARIAAKPAARRLVAARGRQRPASGSLRPCLPLA